VRSIRLTRGRSLVAIVVDDHVELASRLADHPGLVAIAYFSLARRSDRGRDTGRGWDSPSDSDKHHTTNRRNGSALWSYSTTRLARSITSALISS